MIPVLQALFVNKNMIHNAISFILIIFFHIKGLMGHPVY